jgi:hypothetical protein
MSYNRNRARLNKAENSREYKKILFHELTYCYICARRYGSHYYSCHPADLSAYRHGSGKPIYSYTYRSYKTWKHNRKTKYKQ